MHESLCQETPAANTKRQWIKEMHYQSFPYTKLINNQEQNKFFKLSGIQHNQHEDQKLSSILLHKLAKRPT